MSKTTKDEKPKPKQYNDEVDLSCGIWKFRTNIFGRKFANLYVFTIIVAITEFFSELVYDAISMQLMSMERQFNIKTEQAANFQLSSRIGSLSTQLWVGHFAQKFNIPVVVGVSGILQGLVTIAPAFMQILEPYSLPDVVPSGHSNNTTISELCSISSLDNTTNSTDSKHKHKEYETDNGFDPYIAYCVVCGMFALRSMIGSFHSGVLVTLYLDNNLPDKSKLGLFLGLQSAIHVGTRVGGSLINSYFTTIPVDLSDTKLKKMDVRWISAWWLAFLVFGSGSAIISLLFIIFPRRLISDKQQKEALDKAVVTFSGGTVDDKNNEELDDRFDDVAEDGGRSGKNSRKASVLMSRLALAVDESRRPSLTPSTNDAAIVLPSSRRASLHPDGITVSRRSSVFPPSRESGSRRSSMNSHYGKHDLRRTTLEYAGQKYSTDLRVPDLQGNRKVSTAYENVKTGPPPERSLYQTVRDQIREMLPALIRVMKVPVFVIFLIDVMIDTIPYSGIRFVIAKYITLQYNVPLDTVGYYESISSGVTSITGILISMWISTKVKTKMGYVYMWLGTYVIGSALQPLYMIFGCTTPLVYGAPNPDVAGYTNTSGLCDCTKSKQLLSCGEDGNTYFSPCYAGCTDIDNDKDVYSNCTLLEGDYAGGYVTPGVSCDPGCNTNFIIYMVFHGVQSFVQNTARVPRRLFMMRLVKPEDRALAFGIFMTVMQIMALPSANIFGKFIDETCAVRRGKRCDLYDRDKLRYIIIGVILGVHGVNQISVIVIALITKREQIKNRRKAKKLEELKNVVNMQNEKSNT